MPRQPTEAEQRAILERLDKFSRFTDSSIGLPFTRFKIGVEAIVGLIPGIGDAVGLAMAGYVLLQAQQAGASGEVKRRMLRNVAIDFVVGLIPVVGDAFDAVYKANTRNTRILRDYLNAQLAVEEPPKTFPWKILVGLSVALAAVAGGVAVLV